jgi:Nucleotide-diphospho-sugar transferase
MTRRIRVSMVRFIIGILITLSFLQAIMSNVDAAAMWDAIEYNGGFIIIRPTANGIRLWQLTSGITSVRHHVNDQTAFNVALKKMKSKLISQIYFNLALI